LPHDSGIKIELVLLVRTTSAHNSAFISPINTNQSCEPFSTMLSQEFLSMKQPFTSSGSEPQMYRVSEMFQKAISCNKHCQTSVAFKGMQLIAFESLNP
jgi:hypothetical protein